MTITAVRGRGDSQVTWHDTHCVVAVVTRLTRNGVAGQYRVIEHVPEIERIRVMAEIARYGDVARARVRERRCIFAENRIAIRQHTRAVVTTALAACTGHDDAGVGVIREWGRKRRCRVARIALRGNARMPGRGRHSVRAGSNRAVVARGATGRDIGVVEGAVRSEQHEARRRVTVATFLRRDDVTPRLADGSYAIVTGAAITKYFIVIDEVYDVESYG